MPAPGAEKERSRRRPVATDPRIAAELLDAPLVASGQSSGGAQRVIPTASRGPLVSNRISRQQSGTVALSVAPATTYPAEQWSRVPVRPPGRPRPRAGPWLARRSTAIEVLKMARDVGARAEARLANKEARA